MALDPTRTGLGPRSPGGSIRYESTPQIRRSQMRRPHDPFAPERPRARFALLTVALALSSLAATPLGAASWRSIGPGGGFFWRPLVAPSDPQVAYFSSEFRTGIFRTENGGLTWGHLESDAPNPIDLQAIDPRDATTLFGIVFVHSFRPILSVDGGRHWHLASDGLPFDVHRIAFDPAIPGRAFAATISGLYETRDRGVRWNLSAFGGSEVLGIAAPRPNELWVAAFDPHVGDGDGIYEIQRSRDGGATWSGTGWPVNSPLRPALFRFDPRAADRPYVIAGRSLYQRRSETGWSRLDPGGWVLDLAVLAGGALVATTDRGVRRSSDGGKTWTGSSRRPILYELAAAGPDEILAGGETGAWRSPDGGAHFRASSKGLNAHEIRALTVAADGAIWAGIQGPALMRSGDRGSDWSHRIRGLGIDPFAYPPIPLALAASPTRPEALYTVITLVQPRPETRLAGSRDGGATWTYRSTPVASASTGVRLAVDPRDPDRLYWADANSAERRRFIWRSEDGGGTWHPLFEFRGNDFLVDVAIDPAEPDTLFALAGISLWRSLDAGAHWSRVGRGLPYGYGLAIDPERHREVYVAAASGVFQSRDGGATFHRLGRALLPPQERSVAIASGGRILTASATDGVLLWHPETGRFERAGAGLPPGAVFSSPSLAVDPASRSTVYSGSQGRSVWRLDLDE